MDEALATYSEYVFFEEYYPELRDWWWQFRVYTFVPEGATDVQSVGSNVYHFESVRAYINAVYLRGARMLQQLRADLGTEAFFAWLAAYAQAGDGQIATPDMLWTLLTPEQRAATEETRAEYLGDT
jgi:aminopeptidase N